MKLAPTLPPKIMAKGTWARLSVVKDKMFLTMYGNEKEYKKYGINRLNTRIIAVKREVRSLLEIHQYKIYSLN